MTTFLTLAALVCLTLATAVGALELQDAAQRIRRSGR